MASHLSDAGEALEEFKEWIRIQYVNMTDEDYYNLIELIRDYCKAELGE